MKLPYQNVTNLETGGLDPYAVQKDFDHIGQYAPDGPGPFLYNSRIEGTNGAFSATYTATASIYQDGAATSPMRLAWTPPVRAWWEVTLHVGQVYKLDAAYHAGYIFQVISPAADNGATQAVATTTQHNSVNQISPYTVTKMWSLAANTTYIITATIAMGGGSWAYYQNHDYLWMHGKGWAR